MVNIPLPYYLPRVHIIFYFPVHTTYNNDFITYTNQLEYKGKNAVLTLLKQWTSEELLEIDNIKPFPSIIYWNWIITWNYQHSFIVNNK